jgi:AcrR family transcriptional regulator
MARRAASRTRRAGRRPSVVDQEPVRAVDGRLPGRRGRATRERLLQCTAELLEKTSYRDLKVIDIARCAETSPATFYQYFPDVEAAILVLAAQMAENGKGLTSLIHGSTWSGREGWDTALQLVDAFLDLWDRHHALLRVVDLATLEGDLRFQNIRTHLLNEVTTALRDVVEKFKADGRHPADLDPMAQAASLVSLLAHVASHRYGFEFWGIRMDGMRRSLAGIIFWSLTGKRPPD